MQSCQITAWGAPLELRDYPTPKPQGREVLLEVEACGVCHSDYHIWQGYYDLGGGERIGMAERGLRLPFTMGHEVAGRVAALGPEARDAGLKLGDRRVVYPWIGCGQCEVCRRGQELLCLKPRIVGTWRDGGYSTHVLVPDPRYLVDFGDVPIEVACTYACSGITALSALRKTGAEEERDRVLLIGAGGVGLNGLHLARAVLPSPPVVADVDAGKREAALAAGAALAVDNASADAVAAVKEWSGGGVAAAIDFVGRPETSRFALDCLRKGGTLVAVGLYGDRLPLPLPWLPLRMLYPARLVRRHARGSEGPDRPCSGRQGTGTADHEPPPGRGGRGPAGVGSRRCARPHRAAALRARVPMSQTARPLTVTDIASRKGGQPLVCLTAATAPLARLFDPVCDLLLVGDSLGMVLYGMPSTLGVRLELMIRHGQAVVAAARHALVVVDLPFGSYQESKEQAFRSAARAMAETGCGAVKLEGGATMAATVAFLVERGIPVVGPYRPPAAVGACAGRLWRPWPGGGRGRGDPGRCPGDHGRGCIRAGRRGGGRALGAPDHGRDRDPDHRHRRVARLRRPDPGWRGHAWSVRGLQARNSSSLTRTSPASCGPPRRLMPRRCGSGASPAPSTSMGCPTVEPGGDRTAAGARSPGPAHDPRPLAP